MNFVHACSLLRMVVYLNFADSTEEKVPVKRSYQKIQEDEEDEDDDYRSHTSPRNTGSSATQLVGCLLISGMG